MENEIKKELKKLTGEQHHLIWKIAKTGDLSSLSPEDKKLAEAMLEHEEYHNQFEVADLLSEHEYDVNSETNPFLHVTFHVIAENQLETRDPIEVYQFYNAMRKKKASHHEAIHLICVIFVPLMLKVLQQKRPFGSEEYRSQLKKYKHMKPEKIFSSLGEEEDPAEGE